MVIGRHLSAHLDRCTVQVHVANTFAGSGVFVAPGVVLTCAHVVAKAGSECRIIWQGQPFAVGDEPELFPPSAGNSAGSYPFPDLAVLRLAEPPSHPCAWLAAEDPDIGSKVYSSGFSKQTLAPDTAPDGLLLEVAARSDKFLRVKEDRIYGGLSGSPVLDPSSGRVCALVKATRDKNDERGGWIIPATAFSQYLPSVLEENRAHCAAGPDWDQVLPASDLTKDLRELFRAQQKAATATPYQLKSAQQKTGAQQRTGALLVNLAEIYVRQQLGQRAKDRDRDKGGEAGTGEAEDGDNAQEKEGSGDKNDSEDLTALSLARPADRPDPGMARDLSSVLLSDRDLIVTGGPGAGKSTLTLLLAGELATAWLASETAAEFAASHPSVQAPRALVPLRVRARSLLAHKNLGWHGAMAAAAVEELPEAVKLPAELLAAPVAGAMWLILVDALDEIVDANDYRSLIAMLADRMADEHGGSPHRLLVTSRALADSEVDQFSAAGAPTYALEPFDQTKLRLFAHRWFGQEGRTEGLAEQFLTQVRAAGLAEVVSIPLQATVAAIVFEDNPDQLLPRNRDQLYGKYVDYLMYRRNADFDKHNADLDQQWSLLRAQLAAFQRGPALADLLKGKRDELARHLAVTWVESGQPLAAEAAEWVRKKAAEAEMPVDHQPDWMEVGLIIAMTTGLFVREGNDIFFPHQSFAEYLAAGYYAKRLSISSVRNRG